MVIAYTDGSAELKQMRGGCGSYIRYDNGTEDYISKGFQPTKTGRMEIMALLLTLQKIRNKNEKVIIYSDSKYVVRGVNEWLNGWQYRNFNGIKNSDLWRKVIFELGQFTIKPQLIHIKGHQDPTCEHTVGNNIADLLSKYSNFKTYQNDLS